MEHQHHELPIAFEPSWDGFIQYREISGSPLKTSSQVKWRPIINRIEELRVELFGTAAWHKIHDQQIAWHLMNVLYEEIKPRKHSEVSNNTKRGRYDAAKAYFDYLMVTGVLGQGHSTLRENPLRLLKRPDSKPNPQPFLDAREDAMLYALPKEGHEIAVYALARCLAEREEEIVLLNDSDVDLETGVCRIRGGKTDRARRTVPIDPATVDALRKYRRWRDANVPVVDTGEEPRFIQTRTGRISKGYIWKIVKKLAIRADIRIKSKANGEVTSSITPHSLRRTFGSSLVERGVETVVFSPILGHDSPRITEESYVGLPDEIRNRKILLAAGLGPFGLLNQFDAMDEELRQLAANPPTDIQVAIERIADVKQNADLFLGQLQQAKAERDEIEQIIRNSSGRKVRPKSVRLPETIRTTPQG